MRSFSSFPFALTMAALVHTAPSRAQTPAGIAGAPDEALSETARELFAKGVKAAQQQRWDQCRAAFLAAYAVKAHPQIAGNLSACEVKLGMYRDAAEHVSIFLRAQRPDTPPERRAAAVEVLRAASAKIAIVQLVIAPQGAEVRLDGRSIGNEPLAMPLFLDPGAHVLEVRQDGYVTATRSVNAQAGSSSDLGIALVKVAEPLTPPPVVTEKRSPVPALATGGAAVVALGIGAGLTVAANAKASSSATLLAKLGSSSACYGAPESPPDCTTLMSDLKGRDALTKGAFASFVVGGGLAVAATGLAVWAATTPKAERTAPPFRVAPAIGRTEGGIVVLGSF